MLDHLVFAVADLDAGMALIEERLGIRPAPGGKHVARGTHNALLSLGRSTYLEIIAPDPAQPGARPLPFGLEGLREPRLVTWAAKAPDIEQRVETARAAGYDPGAIVQMSRELPDGGRLNWSLTLPRPDAGDGLVPFLIRWEPGPHPSETSPPGCDLIALRREHPEPERVRAVLGALGVELPVERAPEPALIATIRGPKGEVELR